MDQLQTDIAALKNAISGAIERIRLDKLESELRDIEEQVKQPDFWADNLAAQDIMKRQSKLQVRITPWQSLLSGVNELTELVEMNDTSIEADLDKQYKELSTKFELQKDELKFSGPYDDHDVIVGIYAGAGGTDAQDWAGMLLRMYVRWAEKRGFSIHTIEQSAGEEAGIKSVTLEITGNFVFGLLKGEHGVHRLVRLSPFNADNLRQTSFAKVDVLPKIDTPDELAIDDKDLKIDVYRAGGHGGQSVNTTDSAVRVTHAPTGMVVAIQNERSQLQNKETALTILRSRLAQLQIEQHREKIAELKGPTQSAEWGNQIRSYVQHPYTMVKDLRTRHETSDVGGVLDGNIDPFIDAYLEFTIGKKIDE